jgi:hypothetical protein
MMSPEAPLLPPAAASVRLDAERMTLAARVQHILDAKDERGALVHSNREVRDFIIACIFELGLPLTRELELLMHRFLTTEIEIAAEEPTPEDLVAAVRRYFDKHPLSPRLSKAFEDLGRETLLHAKQGFQRDAAHRNAVVAVTGLRLVTRAPQSAPQPTLARAPKSGLRRGLR